ncbi:uncharacterized protein C8A04DRAFT_23803 [Dichotomopilus funicola]|uniref:Peptidase C45 hydrolase domain-containing protein n=1 Tax=Dichotomopilus funicola TaxID=1934379 RepID=A0AAN6ZT34_9PEZI|nr:hypothetical protein C8A04DRAFT_23803 [Dichotomopilus funicola]
MNHMGSPESPISIAKLQGYGRRDDLVPGLVLTGNAQQRGLKYGMHFRDQIRANVARVLGSPIFPSWDFCIRMVNEVYKPSLENQWPNGWNELLGMSWGSGEPVENLVFLNAWTDLAALKLKPKMDMGESVSAHFPENLTAGFNPVLAHTWIADPDVYDQGLVVCLEYRYPEDEEPDNMIMVTEAGMISGCAMSANGMVISGNRLLSTADYIPRKGSPFPVTCLERFLLESTHEIGQVREFLLAVNRHASRHLMLADGLGTILSLELGPDTNYAFIHNRPVDGGLHVHGNYFQSFQAYAACRELSDAAKAHTSRSRVNRLNSLVKEMRRGVMSRQDIKNLFSDHGRGLPASLCQHKGTVQTDDTAALVVFDPNRGVVSVCKGPACRGIMVHLGIRREQEGTPAKVMGKGNGHPEGQGGGSMDKAQLDASPMREASMDLGSAKPEANKASEYTGMAHDSDAAAIDGQLLRQQLLAAFRASNQSHDGSDSSSRKRKSSSLSSSESNEKDSGTMLHTPAKDLESESDGSGGVVRMIKKIRLPDAVKEDEGEDGEVRDD